MRKKITIYLFKNIPIFIAIIAIVLSGLQIYESNKTSKADFAHRFKTDLESPETRDFKIMFDNDLLTFKSSTDSDSIAYFEFNAERYNSLKNSSILQITPKKFYSAYEIENNLLLHYEDIGYYEAHNLIDIDFIDYHFSYFLISIHDNKNIQKYIHYVRNGIDSTYCSYYDLIYKKLIKRHPNITLK